MKKKQTPSERMQEFIGIADANHREGLDAAGIPADVQYSTELHRPYVNPLGDVMDCIPRIRHIEADIEINREAFRRWQLQQAKK